MSPTQRKKTNRLQRLRSRSRSRGESGELEDNGDIRDRGGGRQPAGMEPNAARGSRSSIRWPGEGDPPGGDSDDSAFGGSNAISPATHRERTVIVGLQTVDVSRNQVDESLDELVRLADTYGLETRRRWIQVRPKPSPPTFIGKGKALQIADEAKLDGVTTAIFDDDLSPGQHRNLEHLTGLRVMDRCELILEIFRRNARSYAAKIQVELAQLR